MYVHLANVIISTNTDCSAVFPESFLTAEAVCSAVTLKTTIRLFGYLLTREYFVLVESDAMKMEAFGAREKTEHFMKYFISQEYKKLRVSLKSDC